MNFCRVEEVMSDWFLCWQKLLELNNLHALVSVLSALQSAPIFRLSKTWSVSLRSLFLSSYSHET